MEKSLSFLRGRFSVIDSPEAPNFCVPGMRESPFRDFFISIPFWKISKKFIAIQGIKSHCRQVQKSKKKKDVMTRIGTIHFRHKKRQQLILRTNCRLIPYQEGIN